MHKTFFKKIYERILKTAARLFPNRIEQSGNILFSRKRNSVSMNPKDVLGRAGEDAAVKLLEEKGYSILHRNICFKEGELDIVARTGETLVFAEVKTRCYTSLKKPYEYVTGKKRRTVLKLARHYIIRCGLLDVQIRYDILSVTCLASGELEVEHLENAFSEKINVKKRPFEHWRRKGNLCIISD